MGKYGIKIDQFAKELGVNPETIRCHIRLMRKETLEIPLKIGKSYRITQKWINKYYFPFLREYKR